MRQPTFFASTFVAACSLSRRVRPGAAPVASLNVGGRALAASPPEEASSRGSEPLPPPLAGEWPFLFQPPPVFSSLLPPAAAASVAGRHPSRDVRSVGPDGPQPLQHVSAASGQSRPHPASHVGADGVSAVGGVESRRRALLAASPPPPPAAALSPNGVWTYQGAFVDDINGVRVLNATGNFGPGAPVVNPFNAPPTVAACQAWGAANGFDTIGLQYGGQARCCAVPLLSLSRVPLTHAAAPVLRLRGLRLHGAGQHHMRTRAGLRVVQSDLHIRSRAREPAAAAVAPAQPAAAAAAAGAAAAAAGAAARAAAAAAPGAAASVPRPRMDLHWRLCGLHVSFLWGPHYEHVGQPRDIQLAVLQQRERRAAVALPAAEPRHHRHVPSVGAGQRVQHRGVAGAG